jgi:hypothetical protein
MKVIQPAGRASSPECCVTSLCADADRGYDPRMRFLVPIWALLALGNLIWALVDGGPAIVPASLVFASSIIGLIRLRWPMDTWPAWLFSYKP